MIVVGAMLDVSTLDTSVQSNINLCQALKSTSIIRINRIFVLILIGDF